jgi:hypothetical protein
VAWSVQTAAAATSPVRQNQTVPAMQHQRRHRPSRRHRHRSPTPAATAPVPSTRIVQADLSVWTPVAAMHPVRKRRPVRVMSPQLRHRRLRLPEQDRLFSEYRLSQWEHSYSYSDSHCNPETEYWIY